MSNKMALDALKFAEAALADIGDADREPGDDLAWCEARAAEALPRTRAAIAALQAEPQGWRPIETAPRDGTDILLAIIDAEHAYIDHVERGYFEVVAEDEEDGPWDIRGGEPWCSYEGRSEGLYWCYAAGPDDFNRRGIRFLDSSDCLKYTHWMPLPTPPKD